MGKRIFQKSVLTAATLLYLALEYALFAELGWRGGLLASLFFTAFSLAALAGLLHRPTRAIPEEEPEEEAPAAGENSNSDPRRILEKTMIVLRKSRDRGHFKADWIESYHSFSFDTYQDPEHKGFRNLRVINEDRVKAGSGFPLHPHRDMEILTFILEGALEHQDDLGNSEIIRAGEVQRITAGTGIRHSETNPSESDEVHLLQIWIFPEARGLAPSYEKVSFAPDEENALRLIASKDGRDNSATIHQDASLHAGKLEAGASLQYPMGEGRHAWLQATRGSLSLNGQELQAGDGVSASDEPLLQIVAGPDAEFLLFDLS